VLPATPRSPTGWNYPVREALAYEPGLLDDLPPALGAPRCFGHVEHGGHHHLWLEDLGSDATLWRLDDCGRRRERSDGSTAPISLAGPGRARLDGTERGACFS
jgi:hypothetical protein